MKKHRFLFLFFLLQFICKSEAQVPKGLIDSIQVNESLAKLEHYVAQTDSLCCKKDSLHFFFIFETTLNDDDIVEDSISIQYYLTGNFLNDLVRLKNAKGKLENKCHQQTGRYFEYYSTMYYDESLEKSFRLTNKIEIPFDQNFYNFIGKLFYNGQIDCAFFYPSVVKESSALFNHYENLMYLVFAIKGNDYYVIRDCVERCGEATLNPAPALISLKDYIDCCWEEMTNLPRR